jgi:mono/diheme cytochrome c family protein
MAMEPVAVHQLRTGRRSRGVQGMLVLVLVVSCLVAADFGVAATMSTKGTPNLPALRLKGNATRGKNVFIHVAGCGGCHALKAAGKTETAYAGGPNLDQLKPSFALVVKTVTLGKGPGDGGMPAFSKVKGASSYVQTVLTSQQIADVAKFVSSVAGR